MTTTASKREPAQVLRVVLSLYTVLLIVAMVPYTPRPTGDIKRALVCVAPFVLVTLWAVFSRRDAHSRIVPRLFGPPVIAFLLVYGLASFYARNTGIAFVEFTWFGALGLLYWVSSRAFRTPRHVYQWMISACCGVAISSLYALAQRQGYDPFPWNEAHLNTEQYLNLPGTFGNPNVAGHAMVLTIIFAFALAIRRGTRWCALFLPLFVVHVYFMQHRAGLVALMASTFLVFFGMVLASRRLRPAKSVAWTLIATSLALILLGGFGVAASMARTGGLTPLDSSILLRYSTYSSASQMALEHPVLGFGPGSYVIESPSYWSDYEQEVFARKRQQSFHAHNDVLELAVEAGAILAGVYLLFLTIGICSGLYLYFKQEDPEPRRLSLLSSSIFFAFLVDGLFGFNLRSEVSATFLFIMAGAIDGVFAQYSSEPNRRAAAIGRTTALVVAFTGASISAMLGIRVFIAQLYLQEGKDAIHREAYHVARESFARGESLAPWDWNFAHHLGETALRIHESESARMHFTRSLSRNANYLPAKIRLMQIAMNDSLDEYALTGQSNFLKPEEYAREIAELCQSLPVHQDILGRCALIRADGTVTMAERNALATEAINYLRGAIAAGADSPSEEFTLVARAFMIKEDFEGAKAALTRAFEFDGVADKSWELLFKFARQTGEFAFSREALHARLKRSSDAGPEAKARIHSWLGTLAGLSHDVPLATEEFHEALRLAPSSQQVWTGYCKFSVEQGLFVDFLATLSATKQRLEKDAILVPFQLQIVSNAWEDGVRGAAKAAAQLAARFSEYPSANVTAESGWVASAILEAFDKYPPPPKIAAVAYLNLGSTLARTEQIEDARRMLEIALPNLRQENRVQCTIYYVVVLETLKRRPEALGILRDARAAFPTNFELSLLYARMLARGGQPAAARLEYVSLLRRSSGSKQVMEILEQELAAP